jgi:hypothetical protein
MSLTPYSAAPGRRWIVVIDIAGTPVEQVEHIGRQLAVAVNGVLTVNVELI